MNNFPKSTEFNRRIPKQKFYDNISSEIKQIFKEQIILIIWENKFATTTLDVQKGQNVIEIEVLRLYLNQNQIDIKLLKLIDKKVCYHILFLLEYDKKIQAWIAHKEATKSNTFKIDSYYHTDWLSPEHLYLKLEGETLDAVYENFIKQIAHK